MNELISIIIPVYNVEKYLTECLESVDLQTYPNLEILLIDDGSTDASGKICDRYSKKNKKFKTIHKEYGGVSSARNVGLKHVKGEYIAFVDSDDIVSKDYILNLYQCLKEENADISLSRYVRFVDKIEMPKTSKKQGSLSSTTALKKLLYQEEQELFIVTLWGKLYKKKVFEGIQFPNGRINEDNAVITDVFDHANTISYIDICDYFYRKTFNSITSQPFSKARMDVVYFSEKVMKKYENTDFYKGAMNLFFRRNIEMLSMLYQLKDYPEKEKYETILFTNIKKYRKEILQDANSKFSSKLAVIGSCISLKLTIKLFNLLKEIK